MSNLLSLNGLSIQSTGRSWLRGDSGLEYRVTRYVQGTSSRRSRAQLVMRAPEL